VVSVVLCMLRLMVMWLLYCVMVCVVYLGFFSVVVLRLICVQLVVSVVLSEVSLWIFLFSLIVMLRVVIIVASRLWFEF